MSINLYHPLCLPLACSLLAGCELLITDPDPCSLEMDRIERRYGAPRTRERGMLGTRSQTWHYPQRGLRVEFDWSDDVCSIREDRT